MIVAAVDTSRSTSHVENYVDKVYSVLSTLKPPLRVIQWSHLVKKDETHASIDKRILSDFRPTGGTEPTCFVERLPSKPLELYIFTDGEIHKRDVEVCRALLKKLRIQLTHVHLYYIGKTSDMNLKFTDVFTGVPQTIHVNMEYKGSVDPTLITFDDVDYNYIMKDHSFKATVLTKINSPHVDKSLLKKALHALSSRILKEYFEDKLTISPFYAERDVEGCVSYVKRHSYYTDKADFQNKMSDILKLFDRNADTHSLTHFETIEPYTLRCEKVGKKTEEPELDCQRLTCDILFEQCRLACIPVKVCSDDFWPDKRTIRNPFVLLESDALVQRIVRRVEPYTMDYYDTYDCLTNPKKSPFSRDPLQGVYVLHTDGLDVQKMIAHNNYILSTLFQNKLPGSPVLWHMVFLYVLATHRFPDKKARFFEEIRFLGQHFKYFVTLTPFLNPPIVEDLNCCFWYVASVCHKAFPNSKKNVLRRAEFARGVFLEFYTRVYDEHYLCPREMALWQLWHVLDTEKLAIFSILTHFFHFRKADGLDQDYRIVLWNEPKPPSEEPPSQYEFLSRLDLTTVLDVYAHYLKYPANNQDLPAAVEKQNITLRDHDGDKRESLLSHVKINLKTCRPYVTCPVTGRYWRDCVGEYNVRKHSYVSLFRRFCEKYKKYPETADHLLCYLNGITFRENKKMPELFSESTKDELGEILGVFEEVKRKYSCAEYLNLSKQYSKEEDRKLFEQEPEDAEELNAWLKNWIAMRQQTRQSAE